MKRFLAAVLIFLLEQRTSGGPAKRTSSSGWRRRGLWSALAALLWIACRAPGTTDAYLGELCELHHLVNLCLSDTQVTDNGLQDGGRTAGSRSLNLSGTAVSDKGLRHLESRSNLHYLDLTDCPNLTDEGVARLKKALPRVLLTSSL